MPYYYLKPAIISVSVLSPKVNRTLSKSHEDNITATGSKKASLKPRRSCKLRTWFVDGRANEVRKPKYLLREPLVPQLAAEFDVPVITGVFSAQSRKYVADVIIRS